MPHLGVEVAAFVDGQLPPAAMQAAHRHLAECSRCRDDVAQQQHLKHRMGFSGDPALPPGLAAALTHLPDREVAAPRSWVQESRAVRAGVALAGASVAVFLAAFVVGQHEQRSGDPVVPRFDEYAARFVAEAAADRSPEAGSQVVQAGVRLTPQRLDELDADGWPCGPQLAGSLHRVEGHRVVDANAVRLAYRGDGVRLHLVEQRGSLDRASVEGFREAVVAGSRVWVRDGIPTVVTWDSDGIVYTVVTDASPVRIEAVVDDLPSDPARGIADRVDDGIDRMTGWIAAS
ncbi:anti-sigma factor family protein [Aeromicrobium marinum]|uniref:anti-sigma factor family protein n=1 Tax=Aeromicrobium marinum TaxID=219314 RepID=UPI000680B3CD|nr:zf-HC2 domain-containing protein [Aeromicrobium marinum]